MGLHGHGADWRVGPLGVGGIHVARARFGSPFVYVKLERGRKAEFKFQRL